MNPIALNIRYGEVPLRDPAAWFVGGSEPADWIAAVAGWGVPLSDLKLFIVPRSASDLRPLGVLVTSLGEIQPAVSPRAVPYGRMSGRLYLPATAILTPPVSESQLASLMDAEVEAYVWHPAAGLVGFEPGEGRRFYQLVQVPPRVETDWGQAHPGIPINQRLRSVLPTDTPGIEAIFEEDRGEIGTQSNDLSQLPEVPGEPHPGPLTQLGAGAISAAARAGKWILGFLPQTASAPTWADRLQEWLGNVARSAAAQMDLLSARERELRRLLNLLATDPDQGLKFALPMSPGDHRGLAPPSANLAHHDVNFNLDRLRGGGPADFWDIPSQIQHDLLREYRRLAERELRLGRHRRAAYIFAELVNDLAAAATALVAGGHFREAAVLYRDRLKNPLEAARCLEKGRLWSEALAAYEELGEFEAAGELARRLEQPEDAERLFRQAVAIASSRDDMLAAARLLEQKLESPDEALEKLLLGWKSNSQGRACVGQTFRLLGRLGRHAEAGRQLERFAGPEVPAVQYRHFVDVLAEVAQTYPDSLFRASAADRVRVMASMRLKPAQRDESQALLAAVRRLAPEDRLLERDCQRFLGQAPRAFLPVTAVPGKSMPEPVLVSERRLGVIIESVAVAATDSFYYAAGYSRAGRLCVVRGNWADPAWQTEVDWPDAGAPSPVILAPNPAGQSRAWARPVIVHLVNERTIHLSEKRFLGDDYWGNSEPVGSPSWATNETLAIADGGNGTVWALNWSHGTFLLAGYGPGIIPVASQTVGRPQDLFTDEFADEPPTIPVPMQVRESKFYIGLGAQLLIVHRNGPTETVDMPAAIRGLACSALHTRRRLALTFEAGGRVLWDDSRERHEEPFAMGRDAPVAGFIKLGWLIAASSEGCQIYSTSDRRIRLAAECPWPDCTPIAVLDTDTAHEFAVCFADGMLRTYRIPHSCLF